MSRHHPRRCFTRVSSRGAPGPTADTQCPVCVRCRSRREQRSFATSTQAGAHSGDKSPGASLSCERAVRNSAHSQSYAPIWDRAFAGIRCYSSPSSRASDCPCQRYGTAPPAVRQTVQIHQLSPLAPAHRQMPHQMSPHRAHYWFGAQPTSLGRIRRTGTDQAGPARQDTSPRTSPCGKHAST